ncbi:MAG: hypothetical protein HY268_07045 [Deltaproteobacteria bacterium]|nr:hypothetical protein [Deltaproteobacteria bacterium]
MKKKAAAIADEVSAILTQPAEKLAQEYRGRFLQPARKQIGRQATA